ncbi:hypothetical protein [Actinomadura sp. 3N508]|uniref:hypothetical protein n=1 Tax=Actinomadura sp. 3N508 TaxID=3375153 RepID=UPI0037958588
MTERGPFTGMRGAPGPAEPSTSGGTPAPASPPQAVPGLPADLSAVRRTDAIIDSLAARRAAGSAARSEAAAPTAGPEGPCPAEPDSQAAASAEPGCGRPRPADDPDPAVRLLRALITDVDDQSPSAEPAPPPQPAPPGPGSGPRRRGPRTIVALGVAGAVLASTGVAAAGGGVVDGTTASPPPKSAGVADDADKSGIDDTDAGWRDDRSRAPVRAVPQRKTPGEHRLYEPVNTRLPNVYPPQRHPHRPDGAPTNVYGTPGAPAPTPGVPVMPGKPATPGPGTPGTPATPGTSAPPTAPPEGSEIPPPPPDDGTGDLNDLQERPQKPPPESTPSPDKD